MIKSYGRREKCVSNQIVMKDKLYNSTKFNVYYDSSVFGKNIVIPSIPMYDDNDNETQWGDIEEITGDMALSLSIAAFDRMKK
jgi:hypothetical protein